MYKYKYTDKRTGTVIYGRTDKPLPRKGADLLVEEKPTPGKVPRKEKEPMTFQAVPQHKKEEKKPCPPKSDFSFSSSSSSSEEEHCSHEDKKDSCADFGEKTFQTCLTYAQELVPVQNSVPPRFQPASLQAPGANTISGKFRITFKNDLSAARWKLVVTGINNPMNKVTAAHLHAGFANENGPIVVPLFENTAGVGLPLVLKGTITNANITPAPLPSVPGYNNVASLYWGILRGNIYVNVHSQLLLDGAARGQLFADCEAVKTL